MQQKRVKIIVYGVFVLFVIIFIFIWMQKKDQQTTSPKASELEVQTPTSRYDDKIDAYRRQESSQRIVSNTGVSYFIPDSIQTVDGQMIANEKRERKMEPSVNSDERFQQATDGVIKAQQELMSTLSSDPEEAKIQYYVPKGERIYYDRNGNPHMAGQQPKKQTPEQQPEQQPVQETEAQRKKRRIEESMGIRAMEGSVVKTVVHTTQIVRSGQMATFRVVEDTQLGGVSIPKNTLLSAVVNVSGNRVMFSVGSIRVNGSYYAVALTGHSADGTPGLALNVSSEKQALNTETKEAALTGVQRVVGATAVGSALTGINQLLGGY